MKWLILFLLLVTGFLLFRYYKAKDQERKNQMVKDATRGRGSSYATQGRG